jgi:NADP-dependent 3-hydroxy acid dehydrogenase YdfG
MQIGITGHTSGIGKAVFERLTAEGHDVLGFSRICGFDINCPDEITKHARSCSVFINNAHDGFAQVELLHRLFEEWKNEPKLIICIGSNSPESWGRVHLYGTEKAALDHACLQLSQLHRCRVTNLRLGYVDTPRVSHVSASKLTPQRVAEIVSWIIDQPRDMLIQNLTILPR